MSIVRLINLLVTSVHPQYTDISYLPNLIYCALSQILMESRKKTRLDNSFQI